MSSGINDINTPAIFVMGLPRSGSTLLSRLLNNSKDIVSVNDLYFLQAVLAMNVASGKLSDKQTEELADLLLNVINVRANAKEEFIGQLHISADNIQKIKQTVLDKQKLKCYEWHHLMNDLLSLVAESLGKTRWADKTPQNFYHFYLLAERFPKAQFIFLLRNPQSVLASFKYASGEGHDLRRYHPIIYSLYWRSAVRFYEEVKNHPRVMMLRYEDLLSDTTEVCSKLSAFLNTEIEVPELTSLGHNSSFVKNDRKNITSTESWICEYLCKKEMNTLNYSFQTSSFNIKDLPYLLSVSCKFVIFQAMRAFKDKESRHRMMTFMRGLGKQ